MYRPVIQLHALVAASLSLMANAASIRVPKQIGRGSKTILTPSRRNKYTPHVGYRHAERDKGKQFSEFLALEARNLASGKWKYKEFRHE